MRSHFIAALGAASLAMIVGLIAPTQPAKAGEVDAKRLLAADKPENAGQWMTYGRDYSEQRYSPLKQVNADNVKDLGLAWYADLSERGGVYETTPIVVDGRIYVTSPWSKVYAFDAKTGKRL
jgi:quinohemoprotein ethanol dehydrogenase